MRSGRCRQSAPALSQCSPRMHTQDFLTFALQDEGLTWCIWFANAGAEAVEMLPAALLGQSLEGWAHPGAGLWGWMEWGGKMATGSLGPFANPGSSSLGFLQNHMPTAQPQRQDPAFTTGWHARATRLRRVTEFPSLRLIPGGAPGPPCWELGQAVHCAAGYWGP